MRTSAGLVIAALCLAGCQTAGPTSPTSTLSAARAMGGSATAAEAGWRVFCNGSPAARPQYGEVVASCQLSNRAAGNPVLSIESGALQVNGPIDDDRFDNLCAGEPHRVLVDGREIQSLPQAQQLDTVLAGSIIGRETQRAWPYCYVGIDEVPLAGIRDALALLIREWDEHFG